MTIMDMNAIRAAFGAGILCVCLTEMPARCMNAELLVALPGSHAVLLDRDGSVSVGGT